MITLFLLDENAEILAANQVQQLGPSDMLRPFIAYALGETKPVSILVSDQEMGEDGEWTAGTWHETVYDSTNAENLGIDADTDEQDAIDEIIKRIEEEVSLHS